MTYNRPRVETKRLSEAGTQKMALMDCINILSLLLPSIAGVLTVCMRDGNRLASCNAGKTHVTQHIDLMDQIASSGTYFICVTGASLRMATLHPLAARARYLSGCRDLVTRRR